MSVPASVPPASLPATGTPSTTGQHDQAPAAPKSTAARVKSIARTVIHHAKRHTGVGMVCAVAYFDPGNWGVDLQAGSQFGYRLLFVVLLAGIIAVFLQVLASRLGCVTGLDLASHCRLLLHSRPKNRLLWRWLALYPLYVLSEVAIIATDLAELLGSAIALCLLFPKLQLWHGVLITAFDVFLLLLFGDPLRGRPVRMFEMLIAFLVLAVLICMTIIIAKVDIHWGHAFQGYLPSKYVFSSGALYTSVGIIGATVMPHSLFLGSALATQNRLAPVPIPGASKKSGLKDADTDTERTGSSRTSSYLPPVSSAPTPTPQPPVHVRIANAVRGAVRAACRVPEPSEFSTQATCHAEHENRPLALVRAHIYHGTVDMVISLLGFAVVINSFILILASAVFFYGAGKTHSGDPASLFDAYNLIRDIVGQGAATLFAVALLAAGQSSSIIATVAGQAVSEGFLHWRVSPAMRRIVTRLIAMIPAMVVAIAVGRSGIDSLLVVSQVVLSIVLPFITVPLVYLTSSKAIMSVRVPGPGASQGEGEVEMEAGETVVDFSSGRVATACGGVICVVIVAANIYALATINQSY